MPTPKERFEHNLTTLVHYFDQVVEDAFAHRQELGLSKDDVATLDSLYTSIQLIADEPRSPQ